jgi:carbamate kinase
VRVVAALGGNALLRRGEVPSTENQRRNALIAAAALVPLAERHDLIVTHGSGPQVGLLALRSAASPEGPSPLDVLDAETAGQIGYLIEQELLNRLPPRRHCAALLTQIEVDPADPAFLAPTKPIGPVYSREEAEALAKNKGWRVAPDGPHYRRVVASPAPREIVELPVIELLVRARVVVICLGGGGIPVVRAADGTLTGTEAVVDKDLASSLLARRIKADALLMLTDVDAVYENWGKPGAKALRRISPEAIAELSFESGTMAPKVAAACRFCAERNAVAGIGALADAAAILEGEAGTLVVPGAGETLYW